EHRLLAFGRRYEQIAAPFEWKFTRADLDRLAQRLDLPASQAARANTCANFRARALSASVATSDPISRGRETWHFCARTPAPRPAGWILPASPS
ncbi:MAG: hypothetical protein ACRDL5_18020, partial [Solirubrobacteraceae bacterium]